MDVDLFSEPLDLYVETVIAGIRERLAAQPCADVVQWSEDDFNRLFVADAYIEPPALEQEAGEQRFDERDERVVYTHVLHAGTSLRFRPSSVQHSYQSRRRIEMTPERLVYSYRVDDERDVAKAREDHDWFVQEFSGNIAGLNSEIAAANRLIQERASRALVRRREECAKAERIRSALS